MKRRSLPLFIAVSHWIFGAICLRAQAQDPCDLNGDKAVNALDVQLMAMMAVGLVPCTANIAGPGVCTAAVFETIKKAAMTGTCAPHSVTLTWTPSTSPNIKGYNVYRSTKPDGPHIKLTSSPVAGTTFVDIAVQPGQTYFYVATAMDGSNNESVYSNQSAAVTPTP